MKVIHISAECYPIAKVGGLADVVGALPIYQNELGLESQVIMPFYNNAYTQKHDFKSVYKSTLKIGDNHLDFKILVPKKKELRFDLFLVDIPFVLHTDYVYSSNDTARFIAFQIAVLDWIINLKKLPEIIHCHDYHTGLIPFLMSHGLDYDMLRNIPSVLTIHNAQYQGWFSTDQIPLIPLFHSANLGLLVWDNMINPLAAAIKCAWRVVSVSPSYMEELKYKANGLEALLQAENSKCLGILNGIDNEVWDPNTDKNLIKTYAVNTVQSGKKANKKWLCEQFNLDINKPLFVFIGRLVGEKGADLFTQIFKTVLSRLDLSILLLGSGDKNVEGQLAALSHEAKGRFNAYLGYDEKLAHIMYAGGDFLLMPSRVEPCGLNQLYALRYGTIPIVNKTGGLKDTVIDMGEGGFGFVHPSVNVQEVSIAIARAVEFYKNSQDCKKIRKLIMRKDHSWITSATAYINLYNLLTEKI